jgi:hypothetical protein
VPIPVPNAGITAHVLSAGSGLEEAQTASFEGSSASTHTGASSVVFTATLRVSS